MESITATGPKFDRVRRVLVKKPSHRDHPLVKYVLERGLISARKLCKILDCKIEDITDGI